MGGEAGLKARCGRRVYYPDLKALRERFRACGCSFRSRHVCCRVRGIPRPRLFPKARQSPVARTTKYLWYPLAVDPLPPLVRVPHSANPPSPSCPAPCSPRPPRLRPPRTLRLPSHRASTISAASTTGAGSKITPTRSWGRPSRPGFRPNAAPYCRGLVLLLLVPLRAVDTPRCGCRAPAPIVAFVGFRCGLFWQLFAPYARLNLERASKG